jgi:hypothetical protein
MSLIPPFDTLPGLEKEEVLLLRAFRHSPEGKLLIRLLGEYPVPRRIGPDAPAHNDSYLLGAHEMYDAVKIALRDIGRPPEPERKPLPQPSYRSTPKPAATTKD